MAGPKEIQVDETGPDFVIQNMERILTKSRCETAPLVPLDLFKDDQEVIAFYHGLDIS